MTLRIGFTSEFVIPPLERNGVIEEELRGVLETLRKNLSGEVKKEGVRGVGKQEANILVQGSRDDSGQSGKDIVGDIDAWDGAIGKDEDGSNGIDMLLDLFCNSLLLECVLLRIASVGQPRCV